MSSSGRFAFGDFILERAQRRLLRSDGSEVHLSPRVFSALSLLVEHAGELLDKDRLIASIWPGLVVEENNLSQVISALRRALGDDAHGSHFIQTVPRQGFRFIAAVTELPEPNRPLQHGEAQTQLSGRSSARELSGAGEPGQRKAVRVTQGGSRSQAVLAAYLAGQGETAEARQILDDLLTRANTRFLPPTSIAMVQSALGLTAPALASLEQALSVRDSRLVYLKDDPSWLALRHEPRFLAITRKLGLDRFGPALTPV